MADLAGRYVVIVDRWNQLVNPDAPREQQRVELRRRGDVVDVTHDDAERLLNSSPPALEAPDAHVKRLRAQAEAARAAAEAEAQRLQAALEAANAAPVEQQRENAQAAIKDAGKTPEPAGTSKTPS